jgi:hypothetical protein
VAPELLLLQARRIVAVHLQLERLEFVLRV